MTVVFVIAMSFFNVFILNYFNQPSLKYSENFLIKSFSSFDNDFLQDKFWFGAATVYGMNPIDIELRGENEAVRFVVVDSASVLSAGNPLSNIIPTREGLLIYKVQEGDNLSHIAANFGISLNTILWANGDLRPDLLRPGQEIVILPVIGVLHHIQPGETLDSISSQYRVSTQKILSANPNLIPAKLSEEATIIIPDSRPLQSSQLASIRGWPDLPGYFAIPTTGWNWGRLHNYNAVDIANACGTLIYASAEGLVIEEVSWGWNYGYGKYIVIEHPNGTKTKYAHNQKNLVSVGDYVLKGDSIAHIGNTGNTHGPTGCHLHFEVYGAKNPFAK